MVRDRFVASGKVRKIIENPQEIDSSVTGDGVMELLVAGKRVIAVLYFILNESRQSELKLET